MRQAFGEFDPPLCKIFRNIYFLLSLTLSCRLDYFEPLRQRLTAPLRNQGIGAIPDIIGQLDHFGMSKDDWDTLVGEFGMGSSQDLDKTIDSKVLSL